MCSPLTSVMVQLAILTLLILSNGMDAQLADFLETVVPRVAQSERIYTQGPGDDWSDRDTFDFIVVGAGAGGCAVANRLSEISQWKVMLLEAGGDETYSMDIPLLGGSFPEVDWNYTIAPQASGGCPLGPEGNCRCPQGLVMGGGTTVNRMIFIRGNRNDFDHWEEMGNPGWDYESVLPYFRKMENVQIDELRDSPYRGTSGKIMISHPFDTIVANYTLEAAKALGIPEVDYNGEQQEGISRLQSTTFQGSRWSANRGYILGLRRRNFFLRKNARVSKVIIRNGRCIGVEYIRNGKLRRAFATKEVILSAGAINTPQILMLSGIGPQDHLNELSIPVIKDLPVGQTLYDHAVFVGLVIKLNSSIVPTRREILENFNNFRDYILKQDGPYTSLSGSEAVRFYTIGEEAIKMSWINMEVIVNSDPGILNNNLFIYSEEFYEQFVVPILNESVIQPVVVNLRPKSKGTLTLQDASMYSQPIIDPKYFSVEEDVTLTVEAMKDAIQLFTSGPFESLGAQVYDTPIPACANLSFGTDEYWSCAVRWASHNFFHLCATAKMGPREDPTAVVSPTLKVWGVEGLRVADASVMPYIPSAHLQAGTYMIGEKAADLVKCDHLHGSHCSPPTENTFVTDL